MGRDKVTFLLPDDLAVFGLWLEQLLAESTGKEGTGLLPVAGEPVGGPLVYGDDRLFVHIYSEGPHDARIWRRRWACSRRPRLPVVFIELAAAGSVCQEFFRWEVATRRGRAPCSA